MNFLKDEAESTAPEAAALAGPGAQTTADDIIQGATEQGGTRATIHLKSGGIDQAEADFNSLAGMG